MNLANKVELVELPELKLIGVSVTSPFKGHLPERVEAMKRHFYERKDEIRNAVHPERYLCPSFSSEVLFTYLICMEVSSLTEVPEGMIGFAIPPHRYARTKTAGDPYQVIHEFLAAQGLQADKRALALEEYHFSNPIWPDEAAVYVPVKR
ncbi:hypothetical protein SD70_22965 [Gordoniibacillus kamchatkensis]|uniref:AraC effector-binding domain-containing protein n=1 Tax=Gordoniibacillus kamchatkensis TaxID=1590651 RepID=A0ABR5AD91_9BACL|nr:GyrI-like domain-containing protein [Paenibacillus sp. VKM B-2647]KIL38998.1 hypothetical protein SD70_22965 [Paenibacillus sp. VKM B-2647]